MLDMNIRVVTFATEHSAFRTALDCFLASWKLKAGPYYDKIRFTILVSPAASDETERQCSELATKYPVEFRRPSAGVLNAYRYYWPISFLDEEQYATDLVIYCPPNTLVASDLSALIEEAFCEGRILAPGYLDLEGAADGGQSAPGVSPRLALWFVALPESARRMLAGQLPTAFAAAGFPESKQPTYLDIVRTLAEAFTGVLDTQNVPYRVLGPSVLYELSGSQRAAAGDDIDFDSVRLYTVTDAPGSKYGWMGLFSDALTVREFLEDSDLSGGWLYYQRDLRRVYQKAGSHDPLTRSRDLFKTENDPYYIFAGDYRHTSSGIRCLHYLCHALNELGEEAYLVNVKITSSYLRTPVLTPDTVSRHHQSGRTPVALYPEVVAGNPLKAPVVARWLLNVPGHLGGDTVYDDGDLVYYYADWCLPEGMSGTPLELPTVDTRFFNNEDNPEDIRRSGACYYAHKYLAFGGKILPEHQSLTSLCHDIPRSPEELAAILRRSDVLYCYEPSAIIHEALACGCPVLLVPTEYWRIGADDPHLLEPGIALAEGPGSAQRARATLGDSVARLAEKQHTAWHQIARFIEQTQSRSQVVRASGPSESVDYVKGFLGMTKAEMPAYAKDVLAETLKSQSEVSSAEVKYALWKTRHPAEGGALALLEQVLGKQESLPFFQFAIPLLDGQIGDLTHTLESIAQQAYSRWSVCVLSHDPAPPGFTDTNELRWLTVSEPAFCGALNQVVMSGGFDWFGVLAAGDCLAPHALPSLAECIVRHPDWAVVYPDEDNLTEANDSKRPYFKSEFSIYTLRSAPYALGTGLSFRRDLLQRLSGVNEAFEGVELFDLTLRAFEVIGSLGFGHAADVLYHRSSLGGYGTLSQDEIIALRHKALVEHFERLKLPADVEPSVLPGTFRIRYRHDGEATVSIIIPTLNGGGFLQRCIGAIVENTDYKNWELIVVDQESDDPDTLKYLGFLGGTDGDAVHIVRQPRTVGLPSLINAGVREARGRYLLFMSDATAPLRRDWLDEMLGYAVQADVGAVGAKMIGPDSNVSFAGYILGLEGKPAGLHDLHATPEALGYFGGLQVPGTPSAVSATCMLTERALFERLGGFDEQSLAGSYSDVDYCLKVGKAGLAVVWTPFALLLQEHMFEPPKTTGSGVEQVAGQQRIWDLPTPEAQVMFDRWRDRIAFDPAYNRNLSLVSGAFEIETIPALTWDPEFRPVPRILGLTGDRTGSGEYRVIAPMRALANAARIQGFDTSEYLSIPELARMSPDVVIFQRQVKPHQVQLIELYRRNSNAFRVFELDDLMTNIQLGNQARQGYLDKDLVKRFRQALDMCDRFVVSTDFLAQEFLKFKTEIRVAQNYIERAKWDGLAPKRRQGRKPRVGWAGSVTHEADLAIVADVVKTLADEVDWVFLGLCPEGVRKQVEYHAGVPIGDYPAKLASLNLDLAIAPLEDVPFNHGKSHLRLLEYGVLGYPVVCTDITPYRGAYPVTRVKNRFKDWVEAIRALVSDMDELARQGDALRDYISANWMLEDNLDSWLDAWLPS